MYIEISEGDKREKMKNLVLEIIIVNFPLRGLTQIFKYKKFRAAIKKQKHTVHQDYHIYYDESNSRNSKNKSKISYKEHL